MNRTQHRPHHHSLWVLNIVVIFGIFFALFPTHVAAQSARPPRIVRQIMPAAVSNKACNPPAACPKGPTPTIDVLYGQSKTSSNRTVVLNWANTNAKIGAYDVYRSVGTSAESYIATTRAITSTSDLAAFQSGLSSDTLDGLRQTFSPTGYYTDTISVNQLITTLASVNGLIAAQSRTITETRTLIKARTAVQRIPALAQKMGLSYTHVNTSNLSSIYTYNIYKAGTTSPLIGSVTISADGATPNIPQPTGLREAGVYDGPSDVGVIGTARAVTSPERYDPGIMQTEVSNDGKVFLTWTKGTVTGGRIVSGYNVYRKDATAILWNKVNIDPVSISNYQPISPPPVVFDTKTVTRTVAAYSDDAYYFVDDIITAPAQYKSWNYKVCPLDIANNEGTCSTTISAIKRDLIPPTPVDKIVATPLYPAQPSVLPGRIQLSWRYFDLDRSGAGATPTFYVTRAISTGLKLANWTPIATIPAPTRNITTTYIDTPPVGNIYWYRIQVRDNAGNWSAASRPVKGAVFDRIAPAQPTLGTENSKTPCIDKLPSRLAVPSDVTQVLLYRKLGTGKWVLVKRFRPNTPKGIPYGIDLIDKYVPSQANVPVYYKIEYQDANGNVSPAKIICKRGWSAEGLATPRFTLKQSTNDNRQNQVTVDFGSTTDIYSRSVILARPSPITPSTVVTSTVAGNASTFNFAMDTGESLRVGAVSSALTVTTELSSTLNSRWLRNVNNFLDLNITPAPDVFLDAPRNMAALGNLNATWSGSNNEFCTDATIPPRKVCIYLDAKSYVKNEKPPLVAVFRRIQPNSIHAPDSAVPWLQVTTISDWASKNRSWVIEDTSVMDPNRTYEYMAVAHSSTSYEVIGYFNTVALPAYSSNPTEYVEIGTEVNTSGWVTRLPSGCIAGMTAERIPSTTSKTALLPTGLFSTDPTSGASVLANMIDLGHDWTFTIDTVFRSKSKSCLLPNPTTTNSNLYLAGTLRAGSNVIKTNVIIMATLSGDGTLRNSSFTTQFPAGASVSTITSSGTNGLTIDLRDIAFQSDANGVFTNTVALTTTVANQLQIAIATTDPLTSNNRSSTVVFYAQNMLGCYSSTSLCENVVSNTSYEANPTSTNPHLVIVDEYAPWFYRLEGNITLLADASGVGFDNLEASSRLKYTPPAISTNVPDNNSGFVGSLGVSGRDYKYNGKSMTVNVAGLTGQLDYLNTINYVTSYPAGFEVKALGGATITMTDSLIQSGTLISSTIDLTYYAKDSDTTYAKVVSGKAVQVKANYLPIDKRLTYVAGFSKESLSLTPTDNILQMGEFGNITAGVTTTNTIRWPGFSMLPVTNTLAMTFHTAPTTPVGMSSYNASLPKPVESPWEQIDRGIADQSDLDPGLNFNGSNGVTYGCYGSGNFTADMDAYLRYGGFSEHIILAGLGVNAVKNNTTGYDESLQKFSAIFVDNIIVPPSDIESNLTLPYPSDLTLLLQLTEFDSNGCPVGGDVGSSGGTNLNHKYWNFDQRAMTFGYTKSPATINKYVSQYWKSRGTLFPSPEQITAAKAALPPMILQLSGDIMPKAARDKNGNAARINAVSEWLPDGDYGNITIATPPEIYVSGMPFTPNDILLNRYHIALLDAAAKPATLGFGPIVGGIPSKLKDSAGNLTSDSLYACATAVPDAVGCGLQVLDGNTGMSYFGETEKCVPSATITCINGAGTPASVGSVRIGSAEPEKPVGDGSVGTAGDGTNEGDTLWNPVIAQWVWDQGSTRIDLPLPLVFIANKSGGVLAGMMVKQSVLPAPAELFKTDIAVVVNGRLKSGVFTTDIGLYLGYSASQAALRALATHRPNSANTGFKSYATWNDVKDDVKTWSKTFGYGTYDDTNDDNDPVDMLQDLWTGYSQNSLTYTWGNPRNGTVLTGENDYQNVFDFLEPKLKAAIATETYVDSTSKGITPLKQGTVLEKTCTTLKNGHGAASFQITSAGDFKMTELAFGSYMDIKRAGAANNCGTDTLLHVDRVSLNLNSDGEIIILANNIRSDLLSNNVYFDVQLVIGTASGSRRIEGGIKVYNVSLASVEFQNIGVVFGIGEYNYTQIGYFGFNGTGKFKNVGASVQFLVGTLPTNSAVLIAQYPTLMAKLAADKGSTAIYSGLYISVAISVPIYNNGCTLEVIATGEIRGWYFKQIAPSVGTESWGGYLSARVSAEVACLVSAAGQLSLEISSNGAIMTFNGQAWIAGGVGDCEPQTWISWGGRWWGDSWCAQAGAMVNVKYVDQPEAWTVTYDLDVESPW